MNSVRTLLLLFCDGGGALFTISMTAKQRQQVMAIVAATVQQTPASGVIGTSAEHGGGGRTVFRRVDTYSVGENDWQPRYFDVKVFARALDANMVDTTEVAVLEMKMIIASVAS